MFPDLPDELRERLLLAPEAFDAFLLEYLGAVPPGRACGPEEIAYGLAYPWERPGPSYRLRDTEVELVEDPEAAVAEFPDRHALLAFGSNAAPSALIRKFAHFDDPADRDVLVLAGDLHDFDVGAAASVAVYGAMPATIFPSPQTRVRAAVLFLTDHQATMLTWSELSYFFGRFDGIRFDAEIEISSVLAYVSRFGTYLPDGNPAALAAIPARDRTARAYDQRELLDGVARRALGPDATAEDVITRLYTDLGGFLPAIRDHVRPLARAFADPRWTPYG